MQQHGRGEGSCRAEAGEPGKNSCGLGQCPEQGREAAWLCLGSPAPFCAHFWPAQGDMGGLGRIQEERWVGRCRGLAGSPGHCRLGQGGGPAAEPAPIGKEALCAKAARQSPGHRSELGPRSDVCGPPVGGHQVTNCPASSLEALRAWPPPAPQPFCSEQSQWPQWPRAGSSAVSTSWLHLGSVCPRGCPTFQEAQTPHCLPRYKTSCLSPNNLRHRSDFLASPEGLRTHREDSQCHQAKPVRARAQVSSQGRGHTSESLLGVTALRTKVTAHRSQVKKQAQGPLPQAKQTHRHVI